MILIRNDDAVLDSSGTYHGREFARFKFVHEQICRAPTKLIHCPAVLCQEIQAFPEAIKFIKTETAAGRMRPYLHCWDHTDWTKKSEEEIRNMLIASDNWFNENLGCDYHVWATPWGASSSAALQAAKTLGVRLETTGDTINYKLAAKSVRATNSVDCLNGKTVLMHWWEKGLSLFRIVESAVQGSWTNAKQARPEWFDGC